MNLCRYCENKRLECRLDDHDVDHTEIINCGAYKSDNQGIAFGPEDKKIRLRLVDEQIKRRELTLKTILFCFNVLAVSWGIALTVFLILCTNRFF